MLKNGMRPVHPGEVLREDAGPYAFRGLRAKRLSAEQFVAAGVRPDARAEQLDVAEFIALANAS